MKKQEAYGKLPKSGKHLEEEKEEGLKDRSRRPKRMPRKTPESTEREVIKAYKATKFGRKRLAIYLARKGIHLSVGTIGHMRKPLYPAVWVWEREEPFRLIQADVKDIRDKGAMGG